MIDAILHAYLVTRIWCSANPWIWPIVLFGASITVRYIRNSPRAHAIADVLAGLGWDAPKITSGLRRAITGEPPAPPPAMRSETITKPEGTLPTISGPHERTTFLLAVFLLIVASCGHVKDSENPAVKAYASELKDCVDRAKSLAEYHQCAAGVDVRYAPMMDGGS